MNANQTAAINGTPLTTQNIAEAAPGLLRNSIDERIVRIRPMSTPIDQLSRCGMARRASAMTVEDYSKGNADSPNRSTRRRTQHRSRQPYLRHAHK